MVAPQEWSSTGKLYASWKSWAERRGEYAGNSKRFSQTLQARGWQFLRTRNGSGFQGVALQPEAGHLI